MAKKKEEIKAEYSPSQAEKEVLTPISIDFGREDLNTLGVKINEIIAVLNSKQL